MKKILSFVLCTIYSVTLSYAVDMQAHMGTQEAQDAYSLYLNKQSSYYTGDYTPEALRALTGNELFGALNTLMGNTCKLAKEDGSSNGYSYNSLRNQYVNVDKDLNTTGNIIGYYDGQSMNGTWDSGKTYNREHTWPQSCFKGSNSSGTGIPMGYDMQSVRPTSTKVNSERGSTPYGESNKYYDPDEININNSLYRNINLGSYRGDAARVIIYDYIVYGKWGSFSNKMFRSEVKADLQAQVGTASCSVFESLAVLLKWHMNDPVSLTEMVRNDGGQNYQGNRNPFIDYPELAIQMLKNANGVTTYPVSTIGQMWPAYKLTLKDGFIAYLGSKDNRPDEVTVTGAQYTYDPELGRLTIKNVIGAVTITIAGAEAVELTEDGRQAIKTIHNGQVVILKAGKMYNVMGQIVE